MIDISDGLLLDLSRICDESKVGARIYAENIPVSSELNRAASCLNISPVKLALSGGEDYELLFTVNSQIPIKHVKLIGEECNVPITEIGNIVEEKAGFYLIDLNNQRISIQPRGWDHFSKNNY